MAQAAVAQGAPPFSVRPAFGASPLPRARAVAAAAIDRALGVPRLQALYEDARARKRQGRGFCDLALETLGLGLDFRHSDLESVPSSGPVAVVVNRPFGPLDSLALLAVLNRVRRDVKLIGNDLLRHLPELREMVFLLEPPDCQSSVEGNAETLRRAARWLRDGHVLGVSPPEPALRRSFAVCRASPGQGPDTLAVWLARRTGAAVVPVCLRGARGRALRVARFLRPRLEALVLPREALRRRGSLLSLSIGAAVNPSQVRWFADDEELTAYLKARLAVLEGCLRTASRY